MFKLMGKKRTNEKEQEEIHLQLERIASGCMCICGHVVKTAIDERVCTRNAELCDGDAW